MSPRLLRRLWAEGRRRALPREPHGRNKKAEEADAARRLEDAQRRLKQSISPPEDEAPPE